jgi:hypothetical protein
MNFIQVYSLIFFALTGILLFVIAGMELERSKDGWPLLIPLAVLLLLAPIIGRIFNLW